MKILLIQPPHYYNGRSREPAFFPLGLGYIAKALLKSGNEVDVLDIWAHQYSHEEVVQKIQELDYDVAGVSALSTQYAYVKWLIAELKRYSDAPVVVGNALATFTPEIVLSNTEADICVIGEGEITFGEVIENIDNLECVKGIYFARNNELVKNPPREYIKNLDEIDFPAWDLFPMDIYLKHCRVYGTNIPAMNVITARGCPYNCRFCSKTFQGVRFRSVDNVIKEINELIKKYAIRGIFFNDELLVTNKKRVYELCDKIEPLNINWNCQGRVNLVDFDLLRRMKKAGCVAIGYGIESGSQTILNNMNKQVTVEQAEKALEDTVKVGMYPIMQMMYGYPGETRKTLQETVEFVKKIPYVGPVGALAVTTPLPGAELYYYSLERGLIKDEEKYLEQLAGGYMHDGTRPLVNFTEFDDEDFYRLKWETESAIWVYQKKKYPLLRLVKDFLRVILPYIQKYGYKQTIRRTMLLLNQKFDITLNKKRKEK